MKNTLTFISIMLLAGCAGVVDEVKKIGQAPEMSPVVPLEDIKTEEDKIYQAYNGQDIGYMEEEDSYIDELVAYDAKHFRPKALRKKTASLWNSEKRKPFRSKATRKTGDIIKVKIDIADTAKVESTSDKSRTGNTSIPIPRLLGLEQRLVEKLLPSNMSNADGTSPAGNSMVDSNIQNDKTTGKGTIDRKETVTTQMAALIVRVLPSDNFIIRGTQQMRINQELREILVEGIVRPEDVGLDNTVKFEQIAEARISYGGKGDITKLHKDRYGKQLMDIISPF
jgi:flagellar L-ring protein precursor FlgH